MSEVDWGRQYTITTEALIELIQGLDETQLEARVPATPEWTVHDVLAHTAGTPADFLAGTMDGAPGRAWTQAHVDARRAASTDQLIAELRESTPALAPRLSARLSAFCMDRATHYADLCELLGTKPTEEHWRPLLAAARASRLGEQSVDVDDYELFRALFSRRSMAQLRAWNSGLSEEELAGLGAFGPREDDQPIPS